MRITPCLSWDSVHVGALAWDNGRSPIACDVPEGIEILVEQATRTGPIIQTDESWEAGTLGWAQMLEDGGRLRFYYTVRPPDGRELLCLAESEDGHSWCKPELGQVESDGSAANNIVTDVPGCGHFCVMKDPSGPPMARYRCMIFRSWWEGEPGEILSNDEGHHRLDVKNAAREGESFPPVSLQGKMLGLSSPDGIRWTLLEKPILDEWHDTHNICVYDKQAGLYRGYMRGFHGGRRAVAYTETADFESWPPSRTVHHHGIADHPAESIYSNAYTRYPGRPDIHLMFPGIYDQKRDTVYGQLAVSADGQNWSRLARQAIIPHDEPGGAAEGSVYPEPQLLRFREDGQFRLLCHCGSRHHNEWYNEALRAADESSSDYCWAEWEEDRLAGFHAAGDGEFTFSMQACGDRLLANVRTMPGGWVRFELADRLVWPPQRWEGVEGFCFDDMEPISGDLTHAPVCWRAGGDLSALQNKPVAVRVRMHEATIFSITMYGAKEPLVAADPRFPV